MMYQKLLFSFSYALAISNKFVSGKADYFSCPEVLAFHLLGFKSTLNNIQGSFLN